MATTQSVAIEQRVVIAYCPETDDQPAASGASPGWGAQSLEFSHPRTGERAEYLLLNGHLQEANWFKERYRAWFIGDYVLGDGAMYLCTPVDPLFLALPVLESSRNKGDGNEGVFTERDELLRTEECPINAQLAELLRESFTNICDVKQSGDISYYRLNDEKVLAWLRCKLRRLRGALLASSANFAAMDDTSLTIYAVGLLGEYLSEAWLQRLCDSCGVSLAGPDDEVPFKPLKNINPAADEDHARKKPRFDPKEVAKKRLAEAKAEAKAEQVRRETRGMKSISSMFGKFQCKKKP
ncbi:g7071 [Coccomyxa elongata]